jgi:hypothetical protein
MNVNLLDELAKATAPVAEPAFTPEAEPVQNVQPDPDDFDEPEEEAPEEPQPEEPVKDKSFYKRSAARMVKAFSSLLKVGAKKVYKKSVLKPGDIEEMSELKKRIELSGKPQDRAIADAVSDNDKLYHVFKRFEEYDRLVKEAPLTEEEQEILIEPLSEVIEKHKFLQAGPEAALLMAVLIIMLPRLEPMFPNVKNMFNK